MADPLEAWSDEISVLFPGLTRSRMSLDPEKGAAPDIPDPEVLASNMMEPVWLGRSVTDAIEQNRLYVISHPGHKAHLAARYAAILDPFGEPSQPGYDPLPMLGTSPRRS